MATVSSRTSSFSLDTLPLPHVLNTFDNKNLRLVNASEGVKVLIAFAEMDSTTAVRLVWEGRPGPYGGWTCETPLTHAYEEQVFDIPTSIIGASIAYPDARLYYQVRTPQGWVDSPAVTLAVGTLNADLVPLVSPAEAETEVLDLGQFSNDAYMNVGPWLLMSKGQTAWLEAEGTLNGQSIEPLSLLESHALTDSDLRDGIPVRINRQWLKRIDTLQLVLHIGFDPVTSLPDAKTYTMPKLRLWAANATYPAPTVVGAGTNDSFDPKLGVGGIKVNVTYTGMTRNDRVTLYWRKTGETDKTIVLTYSSGNVLEFTLPEEHIANAVGRDIKLHYRVSRSTGNLPPSDTRDLRITYLSLDDMTWPNVPDIDQDGVLNPNLLTNGAAVFVPSWPLIRMGQRARLRATGVDTDGVRYIFHPRQLRALTTAEVTQGLVHRLESMDLARLAHDSPLELELHVFFDSSTDEYKMQPARVAAMTIFSRLTDLPAPRLAGMSGDGPLDAIPWQNGTTVDVTYRGMRLTDRITLKWLGVPGDGSGSSINKPGETDGTVTFDMSSASLGANLGQPLKLTYTVMRDNVEKNADEQNVAVKRPLPWELGKPEIQGITGDELDLNELIGGALVVVKKWPFIERGQKVWFGCHGTVQGGPETFMSNNGEELTETEVNEGLRYMLQRSLLEQLYDGTPLDIFCEVSFDETGDRSTAIPLEVYSPRIKSAPVNVQLPVVSGAIGTGNTATLDPMVATNGTSVTITYSGMLVSDLIYLIWQGTTGDGSPSIDQQEGTPTGTVRFQIPKSALAANVARPVTVYAEVMRAGKISRSPVLNLEVAEIGQSFLPKPEINGIASGDLDIDSVPAKTYITVKPWPLIMKGQNVWLRCHGTDVDGKPYTITQWTSSGVTDGEVTAGLKKEITTDALLKLKPDSELRLELKVTFDKTGTETNALLFKPEPRLMVRYLMQLPPPTVHRTIGAANNVTLSPLDAQNGAVVEVSYGSMGPTDNIKVYWTGTAGAGTPNIAVKAGSAAGKVTFDIPKDVVMLNIGANVKVRYVVTRNGQAKNSPELPVHVRTLTPAEMGTVVITQATSITNVLELDNFTGDATIRIPKWPFIKVGQQVWLTYSGRDTNDSLISFSPWDPSPVLQSEINGLTKNMRRAEFLKKLKNNSPITMDFRVTLDGSEVRSKALPLYVTTYTARQSTLSIETANASLNGVVYLLDAYPNVLPVFPSGAILHRPASGGKHPYAYSSGNARVAHVDGSGLVTSRGEGTTRITVKDSMGAEVSYQITVTNAYRVVALPTSNYATAVSNATNARKLLPTVAQLQLIATQYPENWPLEKYYYWSSTDHSVSRKQVVRLPEKTIAPLATSESTNTIAV